MSNILPIQIINAFRQANNVAIQAYGIDATLYLATNLTFVQNLDDYQTPADYNYKKSCVQVWVNWSPNVYQLRKQGLFTDKDLPILVQFKNTIDITRYSYLEIPIMFLPKNKKEIQQWEIVNNVIPHLADIDVKRNYYMVPRRVPVSI